MPFHVPFLLGEGGGGQGGGFGEMKRSVLYHHRLFCFTCVGFLFGWGFFACFVLCFFSCRVILTASSTLSLVGK